MVTLLLGDRNYALRYQNFCESYSEIQRQLPDAATLDLRLEDRITVGGPVMGSGLVPNRTQLAVGLDAGSSRTRVVVICLLEDGHIRYLSHGLAPSAGWAKGRVTDQDAVAESIHAAVVDAERGAQVAGRSASRSASAAWQFAARRAAACTNSAAPAKWTRKTWPTPSKLASEVRLERERMLLHVLPQDFTLDGRAGYRKPQQRRVLASRSQRPHRHGVVSGTSGRGRGHAYGRSRRGGNGFRADGRRLRLPRPEERARGVALLDFGLHSTDLVVYDGDALLLASSIPVWADHLTRDVAAIFKVTYEDAECLKQQYGCALLGLTSDSSLIEVPSPEGRPPREARRSELNEILEARAEEMFLYIRTELQRVGMERTCYEGIVLTGGGAFLNGMCDMAERVLNCQAGNGLARRTIRRLARRVEEPAWTTAAGLALYSAKLKLHQPPRRRLAGLMGLVLR